MIKMSLNCTLSMFHFNDCSKEHVVSLIPEAELAGHPRLGDGGYRAIKSQRACAEESQD